MFNKIIHRIILLVILLCAIILIKDQYSTILLKHASYGMPALIEQQHIHNLYIGSSMFRQGLDIHTLEENNSNQNYILAYNGNQPALGTLQLEYLLENNVTIDCLYVDMYVYSAWDTPKISDEKLFLETDLHMKQKYWSLLKKAGKGTPASFWHMFVTGNNELLLTWPVSNALINSQFYRGGSTATPSAASEAVLQALELPKVSGEMDPIQKQGLEQLIQLAQNNHIQLCFLETPKYTTLGNTRFYLDAMELYTNFLADQGVPCLLSEQTASQIQVPSSAQTYSFDHEQANYYQDLIHLSYEGRCRFTKNLKNTFID